LVNQRSFWLSVSGATAGCYQQNCLPCFRLHVVFGQVNCCWRMAKFRVGNLAIFAIGALACGFYQVQYNEGSQVERAFL